MNIDSKDGDRIALIVAHPDDETLWAGGSILRSNFQECFILSLCRKSDTDRSPKFYQALKELGARGKMADLDDEPDQKTLEEGLMGSTIMNILPQLTYALIYTHSPVGEYTRHKRHEEAGRAVLALWVSGQLKAREIRLFAYEDEQKSTLPHAISSAPIQQVLSEEIWQKKYSIITETYGFDKDGFEARTTPRIEAFWQVTTQEQAAEWLKKG
ncbi:hypothetical protein [Oceanispirochaeta sp.]|jgi:LmbE family N-acetylglucosaminyl deacetylase|uniref:hypothetical protein n=1 Tax=Oceanispirochaeta sp. TaxID=2035350 RepID=UPI002611190B|nr:hypothetical protein [Oceanispirochaeta sp.]MDA3957224.1 hypothetical protein [Oceanispirochaeta sp.]